MSDLKKKLILNSPYLIFVYLFDKLAQAFRIINGDRSFKILHIGAGLNYSFSHPFPSIHPIDILIGIAGAVVIRLLVLWAHGPVEHEVRNKKPPAMRVEGGCPYEKGHLPTKIIESKL